MLGVTLLIKTITTGQVTKILASDSCDRGRKNSRKCCLFFSLSNIYIFCFSLFYIKLN